MAYSATLLRRDGRWVLEPTPAEAPDNVNFREQYDTKINAMQEAKQFVEDWNGNVSTSGRISPLVIMKGNQSGVYDIWWPPEHRMMRVRHITPDDIRRPSRQRRIFEGADAKWAVERRRETGYQMVAAHDTKQEAKDDAKDRAHRDAIRQISVYGTDGNKTGEWRHPKERRHG